MPPEIYEKIGQDNRLILLISAVLFALIFKRKLTPLMAGMLIAMGLVGLSYFVPRTEWVLKMPILLPLTLFMLAVSFARLNDEKKTGARVKFGRVIWIFTLPVVFLLVVVRPPSNLKLTIRDDTVSFSGRINGVITRDNARIVRDNSAWHLKDGTHHISIQDQDIYFQNGQLVRGQELATRLKNWTEIKAP